MTRRIRNGQAFLDTLLTTEPKAYSLADGVYNSPGEARKNCGIAKGDVIWAERRGEAVKALVLHVGSTHSDIYGWYPFFNVAFITQKGVWSKAWNRVFPGHIQRGYLKAGALPEEEARLFEETKT